MLSSWWLDRNVDKGTVQEELATRHVRSGARVVAVGKYITLVLVVRYSIINGSYNQPAWRSKVRVRGVSGLISPFNGAKCFLIRRRNMTG